MDQWESPERRQNNTAETDAPVRFQCQELYKILFHSIQEGAALHRLVYDESGKAINYVILDINPKYEEILNITRDQAVNRLVTEVYNIQEAPYLLNFIKATEQDSPIHFEIFHSLLGKYFDITAIRYTPNEFFTIFTDISEKKRAEKTFHEQEATLKSIFKAAPIGIGLIHDRKVIWINEKMQELCGYSLEELEGQSTRLLYISDHDYDRIGKITQRLQGGEDVVSLEIQCAHKEGTQSDVLMNLSRINRDDPNSNIIITALDITEKKRIEESLRALVESSVGKSGQDFFQSIVEGLSKLLQCDHVMLGQLANEDTELNILTVWSDGQIIPPFQIPLAGTPCEKVLQSEFYYCPKDIHQVFPKAKFLQKMESSGYVGIILNSASGKPIGTLCAFSRSELHLPYGTQEFMSILAAKASSEIQRMYIEREREKLQLQFLQAQKMEAIGRLASGVAHDFNNLLMAIMGYCEISIRELGENHEVSKHVAEIQRAGDRAVSLTRQLLTFSRQQYVEFKVLDLNQIVRNMEKMLQRMIGEDIVYETTLQTSLGSIKADSGQIEQVLMNLAVNARDAMPLGGTLTIETKNTELKDKFSEHHLHFEPGSYVQLSVSDTGTGMDPETQCRIFEPFFTTKEKGKGTGLGLSTVHGIVQQCGGQISVYSAPREGTTIKIYFPRIDEPLKLVPSKQEPPKNLRGNETILVVEDEEFVRKIITRILRNHGYNVLSAQNGEEAIQIGKSYASLIDLMLTDVVMPNISGPVLSDLIQKSRPDMKILFMSGYADSAIVHHGILNSGINFIQKPFTTEIFLQKIRDLLQHHDS